MKGFAYLYTLIIISLIVIATTSYIVLRSNNISNSIYDFQQPEPIQIYNMIPLMYKIVENSTTTMKDNILNKTLYQWINGLKTAPGETSLINLVNSAHLRQLYNIYLKRAFYNYSRFMNNTMDAYMKSNTITKPMNILIDRSDLKYSQKHVFGNLIYLEAIIPNNISFVINASYASKDHYTEYLIPLQYTVNASTKLIIGSLSSCDVAFNVTLNTIIHIGNYSVPAIYDKIEAWLLKNIENRYVIDNEIPIEINYVKENKINFLVTTRISTKEVPILIKVTLQNGLVSYLVIVLIHMVA